MKYPKQFKEECLAIYPDFKRVQELLESGNTFLGRILCDCSEDEIEIEDILKAKTLEEIKSKAMIIKKKRVLYQKWCKLYEKAFYQIKDGFVE